MTAVDRFPHGYPDYDRPVKVVLTADVSAYVATLTAIRKGHNAPPANWRERRRYGRHSRHNTQTARRTDPARSGQVQDAIRSVVSGRQELRRTGQPINTRSAV